MKLFSPFIVIICLAWSNLVIAQENTVANWDIDSEYHFHEWTQGSSGEDFVGEHLKRLREWRKDSKLKFPGKKKVIKNKAFKYDYTVYYFAHDQKKFDWTKEKSIRMSYRAHVWVARSKENKKVVEFGSSFMIPRDVTEGAHNRIPIDQEIFIFGEDGQGYAHLENWKE